MQPANKKEHIQYLIQTGLKFGYPICCINEFVDNFFKPLSFHIDKPRRKLTGTGFIPCCKCDSTYTKDELIKIINDNRLIEEPFKEEVE